MSQNYSLFKSEVDFNEIISKNLAVSYELKDTYTWEAIYIVDLCICIKNKQCVDAKNLVHYKAELFEKMANERTDALVCMTFIEMALRLYKTAGDSNRVAKMEAAYMKIRGKIKLDTQIREMPLEYIDVVTKMIDEMIKTSDEETIIFDLMDTGWFLSTIQIKEQADLLKSKSIFSSIVPTIIKDKFGNTIDKYITDDEIREMFFWQEYGVSYQLGLQKLQQFIIEAYKAGKFSYDSVMHYLESTWYNIPIRHTYCEEVFDIKILDVLSPGLKLFFNELDESSKSSEYHFNYITITDTLVLKIETILRLYCEKIGIATMKPRVKSGESLVMEKLLDDLLSDLKSISEKPTPFNDEDWLLIKYALTLKGCNLRNRVAHGLMDAWEYNFSQIVIVLVIILRLSKYFK